MRGGEMVGPTGGPWWHQPPVATRGRRIGPWPREGRVLLTFVLTPRDLGGLEDKARQGPRPLAEIDQRHAPAPQAVQRVVSWLEDEGVAARVTGMGWWVECRVPVADAERLLGTTLETVEVFGVRGHAPRADPTLPEEIRSDVLAVWGLNTLSRPRRLPPGRAAPSDAGGIPGQSGFMGYLPQDLRPAYGFPPVSSPVSGSGETVALLEFGSYAAPRDLEAFWQLAQVPPPRVEVQWVWPPFLDEGETGPSPQGADVEATSDIEWAGALAPGATLLVVNGFVGLGSQSFPQALARSILALLERSPLPSVVSISYGEAEAFLSPAELKALDTVFARAAAAGLTAVAASGDSGAYGTPIYLGPMESVDVPASLPHVLAVGGTRLELEDHAVARELGWSNGAGMGASGGGVSRVFPLPSWQDAATISAATGVPRDQLGRGVPDVAANADPRTGYRVVVGGQSQVVGGTSLAAPLWAAGLALVNQVRRSSGGQPLGLAAPSLYPLGSRPSCFRDILVGSNAYLGEPGYSCRPGWDAVTGLGSPAGPGLWSTLAGSAWPQKASPPAWVAPLPAETPADDGPPGEAQGPQEEGEPPPDEGHSDPEANEEGPTESVPS